MISEISKRKLRLVVLPTRFYPQSKNNDAEAAYSCWKKVWFQAFSEEMNVNGTLYSDYYSKQSHVMVLFYGDDVVGLTTLNAMDLTVPQYLDDSFFKVWPSESLEKIKIEYKTILASCNVTLNFKYRNSSLGVSAKDLLLAMQFQYLRFTECDAIVSAVRLEKSMEKAAYRTGATALARDLSYTIPGQRVDIVCWDRNLDMKVIDQEIRELADYIWMKASEVVEFNIYQREKHVA